MSVFVMFQRVYKVERRRLSNRAEMKIGAMKQGTARVGVSRVKECAQPLNWTSRINHKAA